MRRLRDIFGGRGNRGKRGKKGLGRGSVRGLGMGLGGIRGLPGFGVGMLSRELKI